MKGSEIRLSPCILGAGRDGRRGDRGVPGRHRPIRCPLGELCFCDEQQRREQQRGSGRAELCRLPAHLCPLAGALRIYGRVLRKPEKRSETNHVKALNLILFFYMPLTL